MAAERERDFIGTAEDGIAWATLNRPAVLNAFSFEMRDEMIRFLKSIEADPAIRCVVLRGAGANFMAGGAGLCREAAAKILQSMTVDPHGAARE